MAEDRWSTDAIAARVRAAWTQALQLDEELGDSVDPDQPFLAAGGHSLAAARLIARLSVDLAVNVPMSAIVRGDPSLAELLKAVTDQVRARPTAGAGNAPGPSAAAAAGSQPPAPISSSSSSASSPLAPIMRRIWTWHRLHPGSPAYNVVRVLSVAGQVQPAALRAALTDLSRRHEALRCAVVEPTPARPEVVVAEPVTVPLSTEVVRPGTGEPMTAVDRALYRIAGRPFPMATPPLWRVGIVYAPELGRTWLVLVMHHLIADLRASDVVLADLAAAYQARAKRSAPTFAAAAPSLLGYLAREGRQVGTPQWEQDLAWWSRRLSGAGPAAPLPLSAAERDEETYEGSSRRSGRTGPHAAYARPDPGHLLPDRGQPGPIRLARPGADPGAGPAERPDQPAQGRGRGRLPARHPAAAGDGAPRAKLPARVRCRARRVHRRDRPRIAGVRRHT
jgi:hypothetical protein